MKQFLLKIAIALSFFLSFILIIVIIDPYKIFWNYKTNDYNDFIVPFNKDVVTTRLLIENSKVENYNSFILGSSISQAFETNHWKKYLTKRDTIFHMSAYDENLIGTYGKLKLADNLNLNINNVLWVLDVGGFNTVNYTTNMAQKHYLHTGQKLKFYFNFLKSFTKIKFFISVVDYSLFSTYRNYMGSYIEKKKLKRNLITNDQDYQHYEEEIKKDSLLFYNKKRLKKFENRQTKTPRVVNFIKNDKQRKLLKKISTIFKKHNTQLKIVLPPSFEEFEMSSSDIFFLQKLFGKNVIFNFTGRNHFTKSIGNFLDESHFRTPIAEQLLAIIYKK